MTKASLRTRLKWLIYPGINLHARLRYQRLPRYFRDALNGTPGRVLDAGSGNGMLAYQSYLRGNVVVGVSIKQSEVDGCRALFNDYLGIPTRRLRFEHGNLYQLDFEDQSFDEIICAEVLEHLKDDAGVCRSFTRLLRPGGMLHVTVPNADHPYNASFPLDVAESGGHVRAGYTEATVRGLLESQGFEVVACEGLGGPIRQAFNRRIKETQVRFGAAMGLPLFVLASMSLPLERLSARSAIPISLYVRAQKKPE